jgi:dihydrofolate synthase/folylpolyglutamate synthase
VNSSEALAWLYSTQLHGIKLGLGNIRKLLDALGVRVKGPGAPRFLHVAGTNGKGSVCAMLDSVCRAAGWETGLFTSPHLVSFRERIRVNGQLIPEADLVAGIETLRETVAGWDPAPTFFELTTALALAYFGRRGVEVVVLETGMGGRMDATNAVTPAVSVLTPVALDHQQWLGPTLAAIALEKAGIIKPGVPAVSLPQSEDVAAVFNHMAYELRAPLQWVDAPLAELPLALAGSHQRWNAALAVAALQSARLLPSPRTLARGLASVEWPGRFQRLTPTLILDGSHNPAAAQCLARTWTEEFGSEKATVILGILRDKEMGGVCEALAPIAQRVLAIAVNNERSSSAREICETFKAASTNTPCEEAGSLPEGLEKARAYPERVLVSGSLFLVGETLAFFGREPQEKSLQ